MESVSNGICKAKDTFSKSIFCNWNFQYTGAEAAVSCAAVSARHIDKRVSFRVSWFTTAVSGLKSTPCEETKTLPISPSNLMPLIKSAV